MTEKQRISPSIDPSTEFAAVEEELFAKRHDLPCWLLADTARRYLVACSEDRQTAMGWVGERDWGEMSPADKHQAAMIYLSVIGFHAASAGMNLIATGYEVEAAAPIRKLVEASLRGRAVLDDASGEHARQWLTTGQTHKLRKLVDKFGAPGDINALSTVAHADPDNVHMLVEPLEPADAVRSISIGPTRDLDRCALMLFSIAYECVALTSGLAVAFDVAIQIPPYIADELVKAQVLSETGEFLQNLG